MGGSFSTMSYRLAKERRRQEKLAAEKTLVALLNRGSFQYPLSRSSTQYFLYPWTSLDGYIMGALLIIHVVRQRNEHLRRERILREWMSKPIPYESRFYEPIPYKPIRYEPIRYEPIRYEPIPYKPTRYEQMRCQQMRVVNICETIQRKKQEQHELEVRHAKQLVVRNKRAEKKLARQRCEADRRKSERTQTHHAILLAVLETEWISSRIFQILPLGWSSRTYNSDDPLRWRAKLRPLNATTIEFERIAWLFRNTAEGSNLSIVSIECIDNPALFALYTLKREELTSRYGASNVSEEFLFHGTSSANKDSIIVNNLDWRLYGSGVGNRFGRGISMTPSAKYASYYCDRNGFKTMFVFAVVVGPQCVGTVTMDLPPKMSYASDLRYDSTGKPDGNVIVKYDDHEFYPNYIITLR